MATHVGASLGPIPLQLAMQRSKEAVRESLHRRANNAVFRFDETQPKVKVSNIKYVADLFDMGVSIGFRF